MLVLHRAKLLASNQSVLALGVAPMRVISRRCRCVVQRLCATDIKRPCLVRAAAPHSAPFQGKGFGDRDWGQALFLKNILFLQTELFIFLFFGFIKQNTTVSAYLLFLTISFLCCKIYVECGSNRFPLFSRWQRDRFSMQARQMILSGMNNGFILSKL